MVFSTPTYCPWCCPQHQDPRRSTAKPNDTMSNSSCLGPGHHLRRSSSTSHQSPTPGFPTGEVQCCFRLLCSTCSPTERTSSRSFGWKACTPAAAISRAARKNAPLLHHLQVNSIQVHAVVVPLVLVVPVDDARISFSASRLAMPQCVIIGLLS